MRGGDMGCRVMVVILREEECGVDMGTDGWDREGRSERVNILKGVLHLKPPKKKN